MSSPVALLLTLSVLLGLALGVGVFTFSYADGAAYLQNDPAACANCHVMNPQYDAWLKSSHRAVATCNDCHTPHETIPKYFTKALNGWNHSVAFTTGNFHEPIRITERNERITEAACRTCHEDVVAAMMGMPQGALPSHAPMRIEAEDALPAVSCIRCHANVGHWTH